MPAWSLSHAVCNDIRVGEAIHAIRCRASSVSVRTGLHLTKVSNCKLFIFQDSRPHAPFFTLRSHLRKDSTCSDIHLVAFCLHVRDFPESKKDRVEEAVPALPHLDVHVLHPRMGAQVWKSFDWDALNRMYARGLISDPMSKANSVAFTDEGLRHVETALHRLFESDN